MEFVLKIAFCGSSYKLSYITNFKKFIFCMNSHILGIGP
ncbi:hypothetical protein LEP1GSC074_1763 [Leptospira noguchii str. Hook]|uniref:Uncharacterized protein n=1 Tax=Leptospira noguchii serovar Autumnalis str. ZUN142 TaxID=1085540 RepID=M6UAH1_9LEPT|nr:hypothetical protein LEP1GSC041_1430 [Leptospira noguchii str. 2006001870]EMO39941.1 hypothetical protein LEP1GSC186_1680 [Leptospira noguchii serovar Autumnalis str. ZUN142]EMS85420.1 hypothetical protein LEP1GSC074_1763 [Leptospira noguchii str. Hook]